MKIRGNTVGTPIAPEKVLVKSENLTEEEKAQARENIGAMRIGMSDTDLDMQQHVLENVERICITHFSPIEEKVTGGVGIAAMTDIYDENGAIVCGVLEFDQLDYDEKVILRKVHPGIADHDAATVGQVKASTIEAQPYVVQLYDDIGHPTIDASVDINEMFKHAQYGNVTCVLYPLEGHDLPNEYYTFYDYSDDTSVTFVRNDGSKLVFLTIDADGTIHPSTITLKPDTTLSISGRPADAAAVGEKLGNIEHATYKKLYDRVEITADDVAAAGEEGINVITIGNDDVDLSQYNDILFRVFVPADEALNSGNKNLTIYSTSDSTYATADANILLKVQGTAISAGIIKPDKKNYFAIRANFADNNFLYGELIKHNDAGAYGYPGSSNGWVNVSSGFTKSTKKYFHIGSNGSTFKFPAGTYVEVYGR